MNRTWNPIWATAVLLLAVRCSPAQGTISLKFDSLPSAQGWTYSTSGPAESSFGVGQTTPIFSVDGTTLHQNTIGTGLGPGGTAFEYYIRFGAVDPTKPFVIQFRARVTQSEKLDSNGFAVAAWTGAEGYPFFLDTSSIDSPSGNTIAHLDIERERIAYF